jgi:DNA-binding winged helix-turn-helix (wHTH) protein
VTPPTRYRFASFVLSPRRRLLQREGVEVPLIPRYFDLLVLLVERRHEAVHRNEIFSRVWSDVIVSDGALTQAVRTLRRALGDGAREPAFIRTVSRHGYRFVYPEVVEEGDGDPVAEAQAQVQTARLPGSPAAGAVADGHATTDDLVTGGMAASAPGEDRMDALLAVLTAPAGTAAVDAEQRDAAEQLHALGTTEALRRLGHRPGQARGRALLRDTRWDVPGAGEVPLLAAPGGLKAVAALVALRARCAWRHARVRWASGAGGAALAGIVGGVVGGGALALTSGATPASAVAVLTLIGAAAGATGGAGVAAGLAAAEAVARSRRGTALVCCAAIGGALAGTLAHFVTAWTLEALFGLRLSHLGGPLEGIALGAAAGLGYAWGTSRLLGGGMATPHGRDRFVAAGLAASCCGAAALVLAATGRPMIGGFVNAVARASAGSHLGLAPLGRLLGEPDFGRATGMLVGALEGALFGFGLIVGLTRRPKA